MPQCVGGNNLRHIVNYRGSLRVRKQYFRPLWPQGMHEIITNNANIIQILDEAAVAIQS